MRHKHYRHHRERNNTYPKRRHGDKNTGAVVEGVVQHHGNFAFLLSEEEGGADVFLRGRSLGLAMDGDRVSARVNEEHGGRKTGEIISVVKRAHSVIVGILSYRNVQGAMCMVQGKNKNEMLLNLPLPGTLHPEPCTLDPNEVRTNLKGWAIIPEKGNAPAARILGFGPGLKPVEGMFAVLKVTSWPTENESAAGIVTEVLGDPDNMHVRINSLLRSQGIYDVFSKEALVQSSAFPDKLQVSDWRGREELFHLPVITIDGADAKDFDDAVSLEFIENGFVRLGVHIADVSHYVKSGTELDKEAYLRGTSVYLPGRVIPMLPPSLSNNLCSLVPHQERLTLSMFMDINRDGKVIKRRLAKTVIKSSRRFTYEEVETALEKADDLMSGNSKASNPLTSAKQPADLRLHSLPFTQVSERSEFNLVEMGRLAKILHKQRIKRGALDFDLKEYKVITDEAGNPVRVMQRPRLQSHRLIEEFMLLANESVAAELMAAGVPFLHRRHDEVDVQKIKLLAKTLGDLGLSAGHLIGGSPHKSLQDVLRQAETHPLNDVINSLIVRSMKQAVYSPKSDGHFGIATKTYTHFTSPIRRYPDLMVHRAIYAMLAGKKEEHREVSLTQAGEHCSERERSSAQAEYKAVDIMRAELFKNLIGTVMEGTVTSVIDTGTFVMCGDTGAEGMLRVTNLKPGAKIKVIIESVNTKDGKIDLSLV